MPVGLYLHFSIVWPGEDFTKRGIDFNAGAKIRLQQCVLPEDFIIAIRQKAVK